MKPHVILVPSKTRTRVSMFLGQDEILRANLPPLSKVRHRAAVTTFLEALSLWTDAHVYVALSADASADCFSFNLTNEMDVGARSVFYTVEVVPKRKRGVRLRRAAEFPDARQLSLITQGGTR